MNHSEVKLFVRQRNAEGHFSDGCTYAPDFWIKECCVAHDFLIRFRPVSPWHADWIYFKLMLRKAFPLAPVYYIAVSIRTAWAESRRLS